MKKYLLLIIFFTFTIFANSQFLRAALQASGLTCSMCSKAVKVALEKVPDVQEVKVDLKNQEYTVVFKETDKVDFDALKKAVEDAGFSVASLKVTCIFSNLNIDKDKHVQIAGKYFHLLNGKGQVLNGENTFTIVDKNFLSAKEFKKFSAASKMECVQTGKAGNCCVGEGFNTDTRVYHIII